MLTEMRCTARHGLGTITAEGRSAEAWAFVVNDMRGLGAAVNNDEAKAIVAYLGRDFPAKR